MEREIECQQCGREITVNDLDTVEGGCLYYCPDCTDDLLANEN